MDIALDLITGDADAASSIQDFLDTYQTKPWRGRQRQAKHGTTSYSSNTRNVPIVVVKYSDKPSKINGRPCCHVEWRIQTGAGVSSAGVREPRDIQLINNSRF